MRQACGELRLRRRFVCDCGDELAGWGRKCLQVALLNLARGRALRSRLRERLLEQCCDHAGAGLLGSEAEFSNLMAAEAALAEEDVAVLVVGCQCLGAAFQGMVDGCWEFGADGGKRIGILLWCWYEKHVYVLGGADCSGIAARQDGFFDPAAPWCLSEVAGKGGRGRGRPSMRHGFDPS